MKQTKGITDWETALKPLFQKYGKKKHPLDFKNTYQLIVVVILSARTSDKVINMISPGFFKAFPSMQELSNSKPEDLYPYISKVTNFAKKAKWIIEIAKTVGDDDHIPLTMNRLTALPAIGRKSANVIISQAGGKAEGIIVDLHVLRVAPRIGIASGTNPEKVEQQLMEKIPQKYWTEAGMGLTFLGREVCRPTDPHCGECVINAVCDYFARLKKSARRPARKS